MNHKKIRIENNADFLYGDIRCNVLAIQHYRHH